MECTHPEPRAYCKHDDGCNDCGKFGLAEPVPSPLDDMVSLQAVRACIEYLLNGFESREDVTPRKICLEALQRNGIPLDVKYSTLAERTKRYTVSVEGR